MIRYPRLIPLAREIDGGCQQAESLALAGMPKRGFAITSYIKIPSSVEQIFQHAFRGAVKMCVVDMSDANNLSRIDEMSFDGIPYENIKLIMPSAPKKHFLVAKTNSGVRILKPRPVIKSFGRKRPVSSAEDGAVDY